MIDLALYLQPVITCRQIGVQEDKLAGLVFEHAGFHAGN